MTTGTQSSEVEPAELRDLATRVAVEAAELVRTRRAAGVEVVATKSSVIDLVTATDRETEELVRDRLLEARPSDGFVGEEGGDSASTSGITWVVDPIDGTVNFVYGIPVYAVSIGARTEAGIVAGVVVNAATGEVFSAALGEGATHDGEPMRVRDVTPREQWLVGTGFGYVSELRAAQGAAVARLLPLVRDLRRAGACSLDLCAVAGGALDAYMEEGVHPWDYAAGSIIATEAGARFEVLPGANGRDCAVCAPEASFEEFRALVTDAGFVAG